jgi:hypothetical protein
LTAAAYGPLVMFGVLAVERALGLLAWLGVG